MSFCLQAQDPDLVPQTNSGQMTPAALNKIHRILSQYVEDKAILAEWFGRYMTEPKYRESETNSETYRLEDLRKHVSAGGILKRNEGSRFTFQEHGREFWLFVDGRCYHCPETQTDLVKKLCAERTLDPDMCLQTEGHLNLLLDLLNHGSLYLSD